MSSSSTSYVPATTATSYPKFLLARCVWYNASASVAPIAEAVVLTFAFPDRYWLGLAAVSRTNSTLPPEAWYPSPPTSIPTTVSSFWIVPFAVEPVTIAPFVGPDRLTLKLSAPSSDGSPATPIVSVCDTCPGANVTVPVGNAPPAKSPAFAPSPLTVYVTAVGPDTSPERETRNVNGVVPDDPSALSASSADRLRPVGTSVTQLVIAVPPTTFSPPP